MPKLRVVLAVNDPPIWVLPETAIARIRTALSDIDVIDAPAADDRRRAYPEADILVTPWLSAEEASWLARARWVHSTAVGVRGLLKRVAGRSLVVTNSRGVHAAPIAEHALALVLALRRGLHLAHTRQLERVWSQVELFSRPVLRLDDTCLVVVGLGAIGSRVAALGRALGMRVVGVRRRVDLPAPDGVSAVFSAPELSTALAMADIVVLASPTTEDTRSMIGAAELAVMRPSALLVNVARGALVDEAALIEALEAGCIAGAGLDAFAREPLGPDSPLWRLPNVLLTPHSASFTGDYWGAAVDLFLDNVARFRQGTTMRNVVDPELGY